MDRGSIVWMNYCVVLRSWHHFTYPECSIYYLPWFWLWYDDYTASQMPCLRIRKTWIQNFKNRSCITYFICVIATWYTSVAYLSDLGCVNPMLNIALLMILPRIPAFGLFVCLIVCLFNRLVRADTRMGPEGTKLKQKPESGLKSL